jgi:coiled-coil domain-containing protein 130
VEFSDTEAPSAADLPADPFGHLEKTVDQQTWVKAKSSRLTELTDSSSRLSSDPYLVSSALRRRFREEKKVMLEKQGRDDGLRERFGLAEDVDLGDEDVEMTREKWEAGRERRGLPVEAPISSGQMSVRAVAGTPNVRKGKGRIRDGGGQSPSLVQVLRKTTAKKYDPFADAAGVFQWAGLGGESGIKTKGRIKDPEVLRRLSGGVGGAKERDVGMTGGLLAGYGSD